MKNFRFAVYGKDPRLAIPSVTGLVRYIAGGLFPSNTTKEGPTITVESFVVGKTDGSIDAIEPEPLAGEILMNWANREHDPSIFEGCGWTEKEAGKMLSAFATQLIHVRKPGLAMEDIKAFDLAFDAGFVEHHPSPNYRQTLANNEGWMYYKSGRLSFPQRIQLISEAAQEIYLHLKDFKESREVEEPTPPQEDTPPNSPQPPTQTTPVDGVDLKDVIDAIELGLQHDVEVFEKCLKRALHDLFDGKPATDWNRFLMRCLSKGMMSELPNVAEMYHSTRKD